MQKYGETDGMREKTHVCTMYVYTTIQLGNQFNSIITTVSKVQSVASASNIFKRISLVGASSVCVVYFCIEFCTHTAHTIPAYTRNQSDNHGANTV